MPDGYVYAFSGSHGTGKSTAVYEFASELKRDGAGEVGVLLEVARRCPLPVYCKDSITTFESQRWVFAEQMRLEIEMRQLYNVVVSDRTIVDSIAYSSVAGFHDLAYGMLAIARHHVSIYKKVMFCGIAGNPYLKDDGFRNTDERLQKEVELRMLELYAQLGVKVSHWR